MRWIPPLSPVPFPLKGEGEISEKLGIYGSEATAYTHFFGFYPLSENEEGVRGYSNL